MYYENENKESCLAFLWGLLALVGFCFVSCKDDDEGGEQPFDPSKPVVISDFTPKEGGMGGVV